MDQYIYHIDNGPLAMHYEIHLYDHPPIQLCMIWFLFPLLKDFVDIERVTIFFRNNYLCC